MKALILAGGYGTRLHPLTLRTAKCVLPVGDKPNIAHIIEKLKSAGIDEIILSFNTNQERFQRFLGDGSKFGVKITYVMERTTDDSNKLGAVGAIKYVVDKAGLDDYLVIGADNYFEGLDINKLLDFHRNGGANVTLGLYYVEDEHMVERLGIAVIKGNRIIGFQEKPKIEEAKSRLASILVYAISRTFLEKSLPAYLKDMAAHNKKPDNPGEMWSYFVQKLKINGFIFKGYWTDIGSNMTYYIDANAKALAGIKHRIAKSAKIGEGARLSETGLVIGENTIIEDGATIRGPVIIGDNCVVKSGSVIGPNTIMLNNTMIGERSTIDGSILFDGVRVGSGVKIKRAIVDGEVHIENNAKVEQHAIMGHGSKLCEGAKLSFESRVWPGISISKNSIVSGSVMGSNDFINSCYWEQ
ncbi:MAG: NDP-sugar synthase [Candidatus Aenigmarchaeota archaeon]|nr:NDP-sugar synthase [Candidatus Aenigmarchaeota archaeon]